MADMALAQFGAIGTIPRMPKKSKPIPFAGQKGTNPLGCLLPPQEPSVSLTCQKLSLSRTWSPWSPVQVEWQLGASKAAPSSSDTQVIHSSQRLDSGWIPRTGSMGNHVPIWGGDWKGGGRLMLRLAAENRAIVLHVLANRLRLWSFRSALRKRTSVVCPTRAVCTAVGSRQLSC